MERAGRTILVGILGFICAAFPLRALTPPALQISDGAGNSVLIDSTGVPSGTGSFSTAAVSTSQGFISWSGTVGNFTLVNIKGESKPLLTAPALDVEIGFVVNTGSSPGTVTIEFTDTGFVAGGPETLNVLGTTATYSAYFDTTNTPFGTNTPVGSISNPPGPTTTQSFSVNVGRSRAVSMTVIAAVPLGAGGTFADDFAFFAATPALSLACPSTGGQTGFAYSSSLTVTGGVPSFTYSILSGSLPPGLNLNPASGLITGDPATTGNYSFVAQVTDSTGLNAIASCGITITPAGLSLFCPSASTGQVGVPFNSPFSAIGGLAPYTFSINSGLLPPGLTLTANNGAVTGIPTTAGTYGFVGQVFDSGGSLTTVSCSIIIAPPGFQLLCPTVTTGQLGVGYTGTLAVFGGVPPYTFSIFSGSLPPGLTLNTSTGVITGTPTGGGSFSFVAEVMDSNTPADTAYTPSCGISISSPVSCLTKYASNLQAGESYIDIANTGENGASLVGPGFGAALGNVCANIYTFDPGEELISCCSCLVTPGQTVNLGVNRDLTLSTITGVMPTSVTVKICTTLAGPYGEDQSCTNSAANVSASGLVGGLAAFGTTLHSNPSGGYNTTETAFTPVTPGTAELASISGRCASILGNASGFGICASCRNGAVGSSKL